MTHLEIKVVDPAGNESEIGELLCRTPSVMLGYFKDPEGNLWEVAWNPFTDLT